MAESIKTTFAPLFDPSATVDGFRLPRRVDALPRPISAAIHNGGLADEADRPVALLVAERQPQQQAQHMGYVSGMEAGAEMLLQRPLSESNKSY